MLADSQLADSQLRLTQAWALCATQAGAADRDLDRSVLAGADWLDIPCLGTVAAALRAVGRWSLDDAPLALDTQDWWYRTQFDAPDLGASDASQQIALDFLGLATYCDVWLNGQHLLHSENMFVARSVAVRGLLRAQGNELLLRFAALSTQWAQRRPRPRWRVPMLEQQQLRWSRTTLLGRTPAWSPPTAPVGPWQPIVLRTLAPLGVEAIQLQTQVLDLDASGQRARAGIRVQLTLRGQHHVSRAVTLSLRDQDQVLNFGLQARGDGAWILDAELDEVKLWWPHTHGEPALYAASLLIQTEHGMVTHTLPDLGFRQVSVSTDGGDFAVQINGVSVFCRGACWTPLDPVSLQGDEKALDAALVQVRDAGMNMLRVCGTMVYETDAFYVACSRLGVMVWQDFMFANMDYPFGDAGFAASASEEVTQQLLRWQGNPALVVLCGNSEVSQQAAMWGATREYWAPAWFEDQLRALCAQHMPQTFYWPSSAYGGAFPHQSDAGTTSYYGVGAYLRGLEDARSSGLRFATECLGFSNVPADSALARMPGGLSVSRHDAVWRLRSSHDLTASWTFDDVRDHYLAELFGVNPQALSREDPARYLALSRVVSGEVMARSFALWRSSDSRCRGALLWFLRDLWPGAGWGLLDDQGLAKPCWSMLEPLLQAQALFLIDEGNNGLMAHLINESPVALPGVLEMTIWREGGVQIERVRQDLNLPARSVQKLALASLLDYFFDLSYAYRFGPLAHELVHVTWCAATPATPGSAPLYLEAFYFPGGMARPMDDEPGLRAQWVESDDHSTDVCSVLLRSERLAQFVHIEVPGYQAQSDYFHLAPQSERCILLRRHAESVPVLGALEGRILALNLRSAVSIELAP